MRKLRDPIKRLGLPPVDLLVCLPMSGEMSYRGRDQILSPSRVIGQNSSCVADIWVGIGVTDSEEPIPQSNHPS